MLPNWARKRWVQVLLALALLLAGWVAWGRRPYTIVHGENLAAGEILCFGDSLVSGIGADSEADQYPAQLQLLIRRDVTASGHPGATSEYGLTYLRENPDFAAPVVIVTLGGNDILNRVPTEKTLANLGEIFDELQKRGCAVVYTGVTPPFFWNLEARQRDLCRQHGVYFVPDILDGLLGNPPLMADQIHPNSKGYAIVADRVAQAFR